MTDFPFRPRLQGELEEVADMEGVGLKFPNPNDIQKFEVILTPSSGLWANHNFVFMFQIPNEWPIKKPDIKIVTRVWHPNISEDGPVCLNILRDNYTPTMTISHLVAGLQFLFDSPNPKSPLNVQAAQEYSSNFNAFKNKTEQYMADYCPR